jgi:hypothetical protein
MKNYGRVKTELHALLNPAVYEGEWPLKQPGHCVEGKEFLALTGSERFGREEARVA